MAENRGDGSRLANVVSTVRVVIERLGFGHLLLWLVASLGRRFSIHVFVVTTHPIRDEPSDADEAAAGFEARLLTRHDLARCADGNHGDGHHRAFTADALARGDRCFGVLKEGELLWSCWFARGPAPVFDNLDVVVEFPFLYAYNAHTSGAHRRCRVHTVGVHTSGRFFAREGYGAITAYMEATNLPPLIAARRMGERFVGFAVVRRTAGGVHCFATPGCGRGGFRLVRRGERAEGRAPDTAAAR